ncbi:MAG: gliding motility-associated C-terminal domain-containing protein [Crocinitomicaceae bacterium]|nr:gliding motility-associated C-terminal domain-containing protein [Crocinitomicaceae bacterium]
MKKLVFSLLGILVLSASYGQTSPNDCGNYTTTGSVLISGYTDPDPGCGANVPGTLGAGPAYWDGASCGGQLISTVVGAPVTCLSLAYTAVNTDDYATITTNTGGVLTITGVNCGVSGTVIGPYNCGTGWYGTCGITVCSTIPFTQVILTNTGCSSGWVIDCGSPTTCSITNLTATVGACVAGLNTYTTTGQVTFSGAPVSGQLIVEDCNGVQQVFNAPFTSPINYTLTGQNANGAACDITAYFTADPSCTQTINYTAPICVCNIDNFTANLGACEPDNTFDVTGTVTYTSPPAGGNLVVQVDNGGTLYTTVIPPPFTSPDNYTINGIPSNGNPITITTFFSSNPACTSTINSTAPPSCACNVDIGTFTANITGSSTNNYVLCYGDQIDINSNNDYDAPDEMFAPPGPPYDPGVSWLIYSCPPTVALVPDLVNNVPDDPCFLGLVSDFNLSDLNDMGMINSFPAGTFTNNTIYYVPITMYSMSNGTYSYVNTSMPCYELGAPYAVQYLPEFTYTITEDCATTSATVTLNGGLPAVNGSNFTVSNLLPLTASFSNTTAPDGGTITITGLNFNDNYSFTVNDGNGCPYTVTGGPFFAAPPINAGADQTVCAGTSVTLNATGAGVGGTYVWDNGVTNGVAFTPASTLTYTVTGTDINGCSGTDQVVVTVNPLPNVGAGPDQAVCAGDPVTLNGTGAVTYNWDNGAVNGVSFVPAATTTYTVTGIDANNCQNTDQAVVTVFPLPTVNAGADQTICTGDPVTLNGSGAGVGGVYSWDNGVTDGVPFNPTSTTTYTVTGTDANLCVNSDQVIVTVNPLDDPSYVYPMGLTYCQTGTDPTASVTGMAGGTFSYTVISGGPTLNLNTSTGGITLLTSDLGTYAITYNTAGAPGSLCPQTSTLNLTITDNPIADFTFATYCANAIDPSPTFVGGGTGGVFTSAPVGLSINAGTGVVDVSASTPGTYTVTNTVNVTGCALATYNDDITIFELPTASISGTTSICPGAALPDITMNLNSGIANWDITYNYNGNPTTVTATTTPYIISGAAVGSYDLVSVTDGNGCTNLVTGNATISNYPVPVMNTLVDQEICDGVNLSVQGFGADIAGSTFNWTNVTGIDVGFGLSGSGNIPIFLAQNSSGADIDVTVSVTPTSPNGCVGNPATFVISIHPNPIVSFYADSLSGCSPFTTNFINTTNIPGQNCVWDFGNGLGAYGCGTVTSIFPAGVFDVTLEVTTADGCYGTATISDYITVYEQAEAAFTFAPQIIDIDDTDVEFINMSDNADGYMWDFGDTTPAVYLINPTHIYPVAPNQYLVTLVAYNGGMCPDTAQQLVIIQDVIIFYVPNVFTPDHDDFNEVFKPVFTSGYDPFDYHLTIFNRWGEIVFESYNAEYGWDGTYSDQGLVQDGVYIWQIEFKENMSDKRHTHRGHVTVLK